MISAETIEMIRIALNRGDVLDLHGMDLSWANLRGANLEDVHAWGGYLHKANLRKGKRMSDIDELAQIIYGTLNSQYGDFNMPDDAAEAILAAGFHRNRTIKDATPADLIEAAWDAAYPVPEGRKIPANTGYLSWRNGECVGVYSEGVSYEMPGREGDLERRTLEPLPPLIPEGTPAVWASTKDCDVRRVLTLSEEHPADLPRYWRDGGGDTYCDADLIDPVPIPKEGDR